MILTGSVLPSASGFIADLVTSVRAASSTGAPVHLAVTWIWSGAATAEDTIAAQVQSVVSSFIGVGFWGFGLNKTNDLSVFIHASSFKLVSN